MEWTGAIVIVVCFIISLYAIYNLGYLLRVVLNCISFLNVVLGASTSTTSLLHLYVCPIGKLDSASFQELNNFLRQHCEVALDDDSICRKLTASYSHVVILRRRTDGLLQGYLYYAKERGVLDGRKYTLLKIGPMVFSYKYRRSVLLLLVLVYHVLYELTFHPTRSVYFAGKSTTYMSYLSGMSKTQYFYPRYDRETPRFEAKLLHKFAESVCSPGESYDRRTFVLERELIKFKESTVFVTEQDMKNPHIRFFVERNPGWMNGHSMLVIGQMTWWQAILLICRSVNIARSKGSSGVARGSKRKVESQLRKILDRHLSFQTDLGKREVTVQYQVTPDKLQHRKLSNRTRLDSVEELDEYDKVDL